MHVQMAVCMHACRRASTSVSGGRWVEAEGRSGVRAVWRNGALSGQRIELTRRKSSQVKSAQVKSAHPKWVD